MKNITIHARVSKTEKEQISQIASNLGCQESQYIRDAVLQRLPQNAQQKIYAQLCELSNLIEEVANPSLRLKLKDWRHKTWQVIK